MSNKKIILSLDGGGIKGISVIMLFVEIMNRLNTKRHTNGKSDLMPHDVFDLMAGTSTGGLIALYIGIKKYNLIDSLKIYLSGNPDLMMLQHDSHGIL